MPHEFAAIVAPVTGPALREYLHTQKIETGNTKPTPIVTGNVKLPTLDACYGLALGLHAYREWFSSGARPEDIRQRFQAALDELAATIPAVRARVRTGSTDCAAIVFYLERR